MLEERWMFAVDELGKQIEFAESLRRNASENSTQNFEQPLINFLVDYIGEERIKDTFNTE